MYTDPVNNAIDFQNLLNIPPSELNNMIIKTWDEGVKLWKNPDHRYYTDHTVKGHSVKITRLFLSLNDLFHWTNIECLVFGVATIIHDIGMQYGTWITDKLLEERFIYDHELDLQEIRNNHCEIGFKLLESQWNEKVSLCNFPKEFCDLTNDDKRNILMKSSYIAFSHASDNYLKHINSSPSFAIEGPTGSMKSTMQLFRPKILLRILRICDSLDISKERVKNYDLLESKNFEKSSIIHWIACKCIDDACFNVRNNYAKIQIKWRIPNKCSQKEKELLRNFLEVLRLRTIQTEVNLYRKLIPETDENDCYHAIENQERLNTNPGDFYFNYWEDEMKKQESLRLIEEYLDKYNNRNTDNGLHKSKPHTAEEPSKVGAISQKPQKIINQPKEKVSVSKLDTSKEKPKENILTKTKVPFKVKKSNQEDLRANISSNKITDLSKIYNEDTTLVEDLKDWYENNKIIGHYQLMKENEHEHTDTYLNCRSLISNIKMIKRIEKQFQLYYENKNIDLVLAIGTSAIPLSVYLSIMLKCKVNFTFYKEMKNIDMKFDEESIDNYYTPHEFLLDLNDIKNLVIIDDVISNGAVAYTIVNQIKEFETCDHKVEKIFHASIFRLGSRIYKSHPRIINFCYLIHKPEVKYYDDRELCPYCEQGSPFINEKDFCLGLYKNQNKSY